MDISERKDAYVLMVELPGVKVEDLDISFQDGLLTIQGERSATRDPDEQFHVLERRYGLFRRSITLPLHVKADAIQASTEDGVLQVLVPKVEEVKPKRIEVQAVRTSEPTTVAHRKALAPEHSPFTRTSGPAFRHGQAAGHHDGVQDGRKTISPRAQPVHGACTPPRSPLLSLHTRRCRLGAAMTPGGFVAPTTTDGITATRIEPNSACAPPPNATSR